MNPPMTQEQMQQLLALQQMLGTQQQTQPVPAPTMPMTGSFPHQPAPAGFQSPMGFGGAAIAGFSIPIKANSPGGVVKVLVQFSATEVNPQVVMAAMQQLMGLGMQIDAWQQKQKGGGW